MKLNKDQKAGLKELLANVSRSCDSDRSDESKEFNDKWDGHACYEIPTKEFPLGYWCVGCLVVRVRSEKL